MSLILKIWDVDTANAQPFLKLTEAERIAAHNFLVEAGLKSERLLIRIHPGGNWEYKLWDGKNYADVASILAEKFNATILLFAGPNERELQMQVAQMMDNPPLLVTTESLRHLAVLILACDVYVGNDTRPRHVAAAVDTPVVALFGSTNHIRSGPYGDKHIVVQSGIDLGCNPCHPGRDPGGCGAGSCEVIAGITVEQVLEAVEIVMSGVGSRG